MQSGILKRLAATVAFVALVAPVTATAQSVTPFTQAIAVAAAEDDALSAFYRESKFAPLWVGDDAVHRARRAAFLAVVDKAGLHGLPANRYDADRIRQMMRAADTPREMGKLDVELSRLFLRFASDMSTGILEPGRVVSDIKRTVPESQRLDLLRDISGDRPYAVMDRLGPQSQEYNRLIRARLTLEDAIVNGTWGEPVRASRLERGAQGDEVVRLRDRLIAMGYLDRSASQVFDASMQKAVEAFQTDHGLAVDGVVGGKTLEELNVSPEDRLGSVLVAMERERWMNFDRGDRHIWVNLTDFHAQIVVDGEVYFETKSVIGKNVSSQETPEFSDEMDHMVINPYWYVPRSIIVNEYLPGLRRNPGAHGHLDIIASNGRVVSRNRSFSQYSARSFPFSMRQKPGPRNALGRVKFMFPNKYNIYLHDTPAQSLFSQTVRAFSHGCIRLDDPYEFGHALLELQNDPSPEATFNRYLNSGQNSRVNLADPLPVHIVYRTAIAKPGGGMEYRDDIYGRDARILSALQAEGVTMPRAQARLALSDG
ncbi:murein L,D-transpeptidase [Rhodobacteraceae bacterium THAF1]|uniref:L,D-transpeptidase family protein n=1 Tax=Palleronia sp. THAF1 TaxID=2587842 RepID=UPI000F3D8BE4|nr:L,D-transpeptidase family protein [Palleronia sp. THAF1]QFU08563.1 murein L,D-transpeptidase [Palleronia sp. THAF1]VDC30621.1 murein L,D-transpeptidase [Rhodobacteraceae bacterium THAF1]